jgi:SAM-dependent methyltransferase
MAIDPRAERAFGSEAEAYERHRPGWPAEAVRRALEYLGLGPESEVVDLAAGTGKLTRELIPLVRRVIAVEPSADMRRALAGAAPGAETLDGTAEGMPLPDASVDGLFAAEAFHWFATPEAVAEIARVVRPGGGIALLWNMHQLGEDPWQASAFATLGEVGAPLPGQLGRHELERWGSAFEGAPVDSFEEFSAPHEQHTDVPGLVEHILTWSHLRVLDDAKRDELRRALLSVLEREHPSPDDVVISYEARVYCARRT